MSDLSSSQFALVGRDIYPDCHSLLLFPIPPHMHSQLFLMPQGTAAFECGRGSAAHFLFHYNIAIIE